MAHNSDYSQIWAQADNGLNSWEVARALQRSKQDWGQMTGDLIYIAGQWVRANAINKWAKFKPICFDKNGQLTDAEFKGTYNDQANGIFYGLEIVPGSGIDETPETWPALHDTQYLYHPPTGLAAAPFRITDFCSISTKPAGWDHVLCYDTNAVPNPFGVFNSHEGSENGRLSEIIAGYNPENILGVDLTNIFMSPSDNISAVLALTYPCILVSVDEDDLHYFTVLDHYEDGVPHPLYYQSAYIRGPWYANFNKLVHGDTTRPFTQAQSGLKMTLFLLRLPSAQYLDSNGYPCLTPGGPNLHDYWFDCYEEGLLAPSLPVPLPNAVGESLALVSSYNGVKVNAVGMLSTKTGNDVTGVRVLLDKEQSSAATMSFTATVEADYQGSTATKTFQGSTTDQFLPAPAFSAADFNELTLTPGAIVRLKITTVVSGVGTQTTYAQFTIQA